MTALGQKLNQQLIPASTETDWGLVFRREISAGMPKSYLPENTSIWLDAIRSASAQFVLVGHAFLIFFSAEPATINNLLGRVIFTSFSYIGFLTQSAVVAFFVISGWLVGGNLLRDMINRRFFFKKYLVDRTTRLWIVLLPVLVITMALDLTALHLGSGASVIANRFPFYPTWWSHIAPWSLNTFLSNAFFLQMITSHQLGTNLSLWSLSNEFWYYFLFPSLLGIFLIPSRGMKLLCVIATIAIIGLFLASAKPPYDPDRPLFYFFYFVIWAIAAVQAYIPRGIGIVNLGVIGLGMAIILTGIGPTSGLPSTESDAFTAVFILLFLQLSDKIPARWLSRPAKYFSNYSYSLYAVHLPVLMFLISFDPVLFNRVSFSLNSFLRFLIYLGAANLFAIGFSLATERNTARLRSAIFNKL